MTRLSSELISDIGKDLAVYDKDLFNKTGSTLRKTACRAAGVNEEDVYRAIDSSLVGVIPVTSGKGVIEGFVQAVQSIVSHVGFDSFITDSSDASGLAEAVEREANVIFIADDSRFIAINLSSRQVVDNTDATGRGYVSSLDSLVGGLKQHRVLVIGAGKVGKSAVLALNKLDAKVGLFDIDQAKSEVLAREFDAHVEKSISEALNQYSILVDASPAHEIIQKQHIKPDSAIAACGIPIGLSKEAYSLVQERLIHDPLQIGVATMLVMAACKPNKPLHGGGRSEGSHRP